MKDLKLFIQNNFTHYLFLSILVAFPYFAYSMHIMEGYLPWEWCLVWSLVYLPFFFWGFKNLKHYLKGDTDIKMLLAMAVAFAFLLSSLKLPSVSGSSSHATGVGFGTVLFGPMVMAVLGIIVLIFQVFLLAHGGLTTLGANATSMCVAGPLVTWGLYILLKRMNVKWQWAVFLAVMIGDWATYLVTSIQLALAHPDLHEGFWGAVVKFISVFGVTQIPIAIIEGILTVMLMNVLVKTNLFDITSGYPKLKKNDVEIA
ncbi:cobalt/nickel transport system permease protein [Balneicella halophila]|uniref:Cobalt transport protein CbiM n=1 Tax=Balneicella halophila TaxID=1537566 RepID=A0A7L4UQW2_BALHA|nr:energy-coupling factor ABC transporter permease [Balneicella halophila]PVX52165.1 cobalt/nickel transport system permease protein [Balneicella halophila]